MDEIAKEYIEKNFQIEKYNTAETGDFIFNAVQKKIYEEMTGRDIILKARQEGCSSLILALFLIDCFLYDNLKAVVVSHEKESTERMLSKVQFYLDHLKNNKKFNMKYESKNDLFFADTGSRFFIGTAGSRAFGRGDTVHRLHISELAHWENPELLTGLMEAVPESGIIIIESTANGVGNIFSKLWKRAKQGEDEFKPHFFSWLLHPEYSRPIEDKEHWTLTDEEQGLKKLYNLSDEQINWKRWKLRTMIDPSLFPQEYPINDEEAFLTTGRYVFDANVLRDWYNETRKEPQTGEFQFFQEPYIDGGGVKYRRIVKFIPLKNGIVKIWKEPEQNKVYRIGVDVSEGIENEYKDSDWSVAVVKDGQTWGQVAEMRCKVDPDILADYLNYLGRYYNNALMGVESNNHGLTTLTVLERVHRYPNLYRREVVDEATKITMKKLGWKTDSKTRGWLIDCQKKAIRERITHIISETNLLEHLSFVTKSDGKMVAGAGSHDDCVIADSIATMLCQEFPFYDPTTRWDEKQFNQRNKKIKEYVERVRKNIEMSERR